MSNVLLRTFSHPVLALGGTLLWGVIELAALWRVRAADYLRRLR